MNHDTLPPRTQSDEPAHEAVLMALLVDAIERLCVTDAPGVVQSPPSEEPAKAA